MPIKDYYNSLHSDMKSILEKALQEDNMNDVAIAHSFMTDFGDWLNVLQVRPEIDIFQNAIKGYHIALLSAILGLYQQAFIGLRFFLERSLAAVYFSASEIELRLWKSNGRDTYWTELIDDNQGIFSKKFCQAFNPSFWDECSHIKLIVQRVYRECSEYVHANYNIIDSLPDKLEYSEEHLKSWCDKAQNIRRCVIFALCLRYLPYLTNDELRIVEECVMDEFKTMQCIKSFFNEE